MLDKNAGLGRTVGNPCYQDQMEGVALFAKGRSLFLFNAILNAKHEFLRMFAGDYIAAHQEACKFVDEVYGCVIPKLADLVIASCGGFPKDINVYQMQKTMDNAMCAVREGGVVILLADCEEGSGSKVLEETFRRLKTPEAIKAELEEPEDDYRMALAQIIRVAAMQRVTDIQGPIPYRTMENNDDLTAPYQSQEAVYGFMLEDLDHAVNVLETYITLAGTDVVAEAASADYVYNGNLAKWIRFANSLKLRLAMRISNVSPDAERYAEEAVAHPYGVIESNADNASLDVSQTNDQNPLRWLVEDYSDVHAAAEIVTYMKSFDDPRLSKYFNPAVRDSEYHGSRVGAYSSSQWKDYYSLPKTNALDRLMWMNAAEVAFLKAEAKAVFGMNMGPGTAKDFYEEGVRLSFEQWGVTGAAEYLAGTTLPQTYIDPNGGVNSDKNNSLSRLGVAWDDSASKAQMQERIITQKWIANWQLGNEAWADYRRPGFPHLLPATANKSRVVDSKLGARRMPYPTEERTSNAENYAKAVALLGGSDNMATRIWWDCNPDVK